MKTRLRRNVPKGVHESTDSSIVLFRLGTQTLEDGPARFILGDDVLTNVVLAYVNTPIFVDFLGSLDADGKASAQLNAGQVNLGSVGVFMNYAYCLAGPYDYASNAVEIEIMP